MIPITEQKFGILTEEKVMTRDNELQSKALTKVILIVPPNGDEIECYTTYENRRKLIQAVDLTQRYSDPEHNVYLDFTKLRRLNDSKG